MEIKNKNKLYEQIGLTRSLDIIAYVDNNKYYEGRVEDAPDNIKQSRYSFVDFEGKALAFQVKSELNSDIYY